MLQFSITNGSLRHPYRVQALDTDLSPVYRARRDQRVAMLVLRIAVWRLESGIGIRAGCDAIRPVAMFRSLNCRRFLIPFAWRRRGGVLFLPPDGGWTAPPPW